jgi:hypothetical protein
VVVASVVPGGRVGLLVVEVVRVALPTVGEAVSELVVVLVVSGVVVPGAVVLDDSVVVDSISSSPQAAVIVRLMKSAAVSDRAPLRARRTGNWE